MFAQSAQINDTFSYGVPALQTMRMRRGKVKVPPPKQAEISPQTAWMLAVRDARDRGAFAQLYDHFAPRLKGFFMRGGVPAAQAEDIVQDVMLTAWHKAAQFDAQRAQVSAWIYQIARNRHVDLLRRESRPLPDDLDNDPAQEPDASQILAVEQEGEQLARALAALSPEQREIVEKAYLGEMTHQALSLCQRQPWPPLCAGGCRAYFAVSGLPRGLRGASGRGRCRA